MSALESTSSRYTEDFFNAVNGSWLKETEIPEGYADYGTFAKINKDNIDRVQEIVLGLPDSHIINILYKSYMNNELLNSLKLDPLRSLLTQIDELSNWNEIIKFIAKNEAIVSFPLGAGPSTDLNNPDFNTLYVGASVMTLPDRDYYLDAEKYGEKLEAFKMFICKFMNMCDEDGNEFTNRIIKMESSLASFAYSNVQNRDPKLKNNRYSFEEFKREFTGFDWVLYFSKLLTEEQFEELQREDRIIIVTNPKLLQETIKYLMEHDDSVGFAKMIIKYKLLLSFSGYLHEEIDKVNFEFFGKEMTGQKEQKPRNERAISLISGYLGELVGEEYCKRYFRPHDKERVEDMVKNILETFGKRIRRLTWMTDETKEKALRKLGTFKYKIGYPEKIKDYSSLELLPDDLVGNIIKLSHFESRHEWDKLYKPVDKTEWHMDAHEVNAYYHPLMNEIVFPAGILQDLFYSSDLSFTEILAGIGVVIGHEITHGFDDKGRLFDETGKLKDWWTKEDEERFKVESDKLVRLFEKDKFKLYGINVNGKLTLGENIADLGGLSIAIEILECTFSGDELDEQLRKFFIHYAKVWKYKAYKDKVLYKLQNDVHAPAKCRVNCQVMNFEHFHRLFSITNDDYMYLPPEERVKIW